VSALLIGGKPDQRLLRRIAELGVGEIVEFCGYVPREQLRDLLCTLDVFVVPSHQEGLCIAALEAMACGCPLISTRCGGPEEFVIDGETGFLVAFDPAEMAEAMVRITGNEVLRRRLSESALKLVRENYSRAKAESIFWAAFEAQFCGCARVA
jgi:glycosyltransferase involved in cell wall biosynthesis